MQRSIDKGSLNLQLEACSTVVRLWYFDLQALLRSFVRVPIELLPGSHIQRKRSLYAFEWRDPKTCWWTWWAQREEKQLESCLLSTRTRCFRRKLWKGRNKLIMSEFLIAQGWMLCKGIRSYKLSFFSSHVLEFIWELTSQDSTILNFAFLVIIKVKSFWSLSSINKFLYLHISAKACCLWTWVLWLANCCCWWASVCFISTILILCSIAYFFAFVTVSFCSPVSLGNVPPKIPSTDDRVPGPNTTSPICLML